MSPRYRFGHTSSPWRQERGAECKTSSSSWRDGVFHVLFAHGHFFPSSSVSVLLTLTCGSHLTTCTASGVGFLSVICKFGGNSSRYCPQTKSRCCLSPSLWLLHHSNSDCQKQVVQFGTDSQTGPSHMEMCLKLHHCFENSLLVLFLSSSNQVVQGIHLFGGDLEKNNL